MAMQGGKDNSNGARIQTVEDYFRAQFTKVNDLETLDGVRKHSQSDDVATAKIQALFGQPLIRHDGGDDTFPSIHKKSMKQSVAEGSSLRAAQGRERQPDAVAASANVASSDNSSAADRIQPEDFKALLAKLNHVVTEASRWTERTETNQGSGDKHSEYQVIRV